MRCFPNACLVLAPLFLAACASPEGEPWPTVSFGNDIEATEIAIGQPGEVSLAPFPTLLPEDTAGIQNPDQFINGVETKYRETATSMNARFEDYRKARQAMANSTGEAFRDNWLTAQMELSNISQYTETLPKLRAQLGALPDPGAEKAKVLMAEIGASELQSRLFLKTEKTRLQALEPN